MHLLAWFDPEENDHIFTNSLLFIAGAVTVDILRRLFDRYWRDKDDNGSIVNEVLFFPETIAACKDHFESAQGCLKEKCGFAHQMTGARKLHGHLLSARKSIDICVYCISCVDMGDIILRCHKLGVRVRVITDLAVMEQAHGSQSYRFIKEGIVVRNNKHPFLMHHKFVIVDNRLIAFGSFNWTSQAVACNNESLIITNDAHTVAPFCKEFEKLWLQME